jgi:anti-sigma regulatory factor (Ser/Thr protein kinase)
MHPLGSIPISSQDAVTLARATVAGVCEALTGDPAAAGRVGKAIFDLASVLLASDPGARLHVALAHASGSLELLVEPGTDRPLALPASTLGCFSAGTPVHRAAGAGRGWLRAHLGAHPAPAEGLLERLRAMVRPAAPREELHLHAARRLDEVGRVIGEFAAFATEHHVDDPARRAMSMALDELLNNSVSYSDGGGHIELRIELYVDRVSATIEEAGLPFDPLSLPAPDIDCSLAERRVGGLGIHLVKHIMDEVTYVRRAERNVVTVVKRLQNVVTSNEDKPR